MLVVCFHILAVKIYCLVVGFCDSQYFKALTLPAGHTVNFHKNFNKAEIGHCVGNLNSFNDSHIWSAWKFVEGSDTWLMNLLVYQPSDPYCRFSDF